jgi:hypothetical protein
MELRKLRVSYLAEQFAREIIAQHLGLPASSVTHVTETKDQSPYDLECQGVRYDVKYSAPTKVAEIHAYRVWDFSLNNKPKGRCDFFILVGSINGTFDSVFLVPEAEAPLRHIRVPVNGTSKWNRYKIWR